MVEAASPSNLDGIAALRKEITMRFPGLKARWDNLSEQLQVLQAAVERHQQVWSFLQQATFHFHTLKETQHLAPILAMCCPEPESVLYGLSELMLNAVEHGNLGINYTEKTALITEGNWEEEVERRLNLPENSKKYATVTMQKVNHSVIFTIEDQGDGFDWQPYMNASLEGHTAPHGRGIALAQLMSSFSIEYQGCGNKVICSLHYSQN